MDLIRILQLVSGALWLVPLVLFAPSVARIWRAPRHGPSRPDPIDVLVSPLAFVSALQVGFVLRWTVFPEAIATMNPREIAVWAGLYVLSAVAAVSAVAAWQVARGMR